MSDQIPLFDVTPPAPGGPTPVVADRPRDVALQAAAVGVAADVEARLVDDADDRWAGSPFAWLLRLPPARKARASRELVERIVVALGFGVVAGVGADHGLGVRATSGELSAGVCLSTLWSGGKFTFQSLRAGTDVIVLLGVCPDRLCAWVVPSAHLFAHVEADAGRGWLSFPVGDPPGWLAGYGGRLDQFEAALASVCGPPLRDPLPST